jgi:hypothetical protein
LSLIQSRQRPERYRLSRRLATIPSNPITHACRKMIAPSVSAMCSERRMP